MATIRAAERVLIFGTAGSGKSYFAKRLVDGLGDATVLVWDPESEWAGPMADAPIKRGEVFHGVGALTRWIAQHNPNLRGRRLVIQGGGAAQFEELGRLAYRAGDVWVVVDEAHCWASSRQCPQAWLDLVTRCRHRRVSLVFVAQRPAGVNPTIRNVKSRVILFCLPDKLSREWVGNEVSEGLGDRLRDLPPRAWVEWTGGTAWQEKSSRQVRTRSGRPTERTRSTPGSRPKAASRTPSPTSTPTSFSRRRSPS